MRAQPKERVVLGAGTTRKRVVLDTSTNQEGQFRTDFVKGEGVRN